jgi:hypothetical protein
MLFLSLPLALTLALNEALSVRPASSDFLEHLLGVPEGLRANLDLIHE